MGLLVLLLVGIALFAMQGILGESITYLFIGVVVGSIVANIIWWINT